MKTKLVIAIVFFTSGFATCNSQQKGIVVKPTVDSIYTYSKASIDGIGKFYLGREISHVMGASGSDWLERDDRNQEENSNLAIEKIIINTNGVIADIGAGSGYYSFKLSPKVPQGKIYAVEIQDELIDYLNNKKELLKDSVVEIIKGSDHSPNLPYNSIDLAILVDVYHEFEFPYEMLLAIRKSLKEKGNILLLEYRGEDASIPIKALHKTTVLQLKKEFKACGFDLVFKGDFLPIQHFLLFEKE